MAALNQRYDILVVLMVFFLAIFLESRESFSLLEDETLSYRQILRAHNAPAEVTAPLEDVVIVFTDEDFYTEYDKYPLTRVDLSTIVQRLSEMGAAVIAVDMLLDFNSSYGEDPTLELAFESAGNVQMVSQAQFEGAEFLHLNKAIPRFDAVTTSGYSNISSNSAISESIGRLKIYPQINEAIGEWPFAVQAVASYLQTDDISLHDGILDIGGQIQVPLNQFNEIYIDYPLLPPDGMGATAGLHDVVGLSASDILFAFDEEELEDLSYLVAGRIVLIGEVAEVAHDEFETPVGNVYGVEIIANSISSILKGGPLQAASGVLEIFIALLVMAALLATRALSNPTPRNLVSLGIIMVYVVAVSYVYVSFGLVLSMSYVLLALIIGMVVINARFYLAEMGQKALIKDAFGQYLSPKVVSDLVKDPSKLSLGGEEREMTAYFSDIAGFSTFSEKMTPTELVNVLNDYLTEMCNIIIATEGTVDKFEGDAIIAFWGAPGVQEAHAKLACFATIDMNKALVPLRARWAEDGRPAIKVRMGLNSGPMVVGNMGSAQRMNYTIMGDTVNLAARLEGANKFYASDLMISEATYRGAEEFVDVRELDTIRVMGKKEAVKVYNLLERKGQTKGLVADLVTQYEKGIQLYKDREYASAKAAFKLALSIDGTDGPSKTYFERCEQYSKNPPKDDWDGVFTLDSKG
ncbi:MAG: adenylate cyclase [Candidatus Azotimanducaceae bacterium]|jgi:adenylate cyclase